MIGLQGAAAAEIHTFLQGSNFLQVFRVRLAQRIKWPPF